MQQGHTPSFEEWVEYCFTLGYRDFHLDHKAPDYEDAEARGERFVNIDPLILADYMIRLFRSPSFIADAYDDDQIADAVWFIFGGGSCYFHDVRDRSVPKEEQIECMLSVATMYTDLFDRVCSHRGQSPGINRDKPSKLDGAVYMIWDMSGIEGPVSCPDECPHLIEPSFTVLDTILGRCQAEPCLISALHGLGHVTDIHPSRVEQIIDGFLASRDVPKEVRDYALQARTGHVQ